MRLKGSLVPRSQISAVERQRMFELMDRHYDGMNWFNFLADLEEKQWTIILRDSATEELCGFSTLMLLDCEVSGRPVKALFSGDTIVAQERWGDKALAQLGGRLALELIDAFGSAELYWFLISKGYKTYRFLPLFFHEFYPRWETPTPPWAKEVIDAVARHKYPQTYDDRRGLILAYPGKDRLRLGVADITPERLIDPHVRFFAEQNPGHADGAELCCIAPLTRPNLTAAAYRVIGPQPQVSGVLI
jgi:hypothetical protein